MTSYLQDVTIKNILNAWNERGHSFINARLDGFLDGKNVPFESRDLLQLEKLNKSFRLTNLQLYVPQINKFCQDFENKTGHILTANLYYTPHREAQCFEFHQDSQHSFAYQLHGKKMWSFLRYQGVFLKETHEQEHILNSYKRGKLAAEEVNIEMQPGYLLEFPYCMIHKARNEADTASVHLSFSYNVPTIGDFAAFYFESLFGKKITDHYLQCISLNDVQNALKSFDGNHKKILENYKRKFKAEQDLKKQEGRRYQ